MGKHTLRKESGQSLVLVAIMMMVFIGILMLGIDGGMAFAKRRAAQNAADAGALAGIRVLCLDKDEALAESVAYQYATDYNEAQDAVPVASLARRTIVVTTTIPYSTTFAHFFGFDEVTAQATASAGCFSPNYGEGVLPVAWSCRPPVPGWPSDSQGCQQQRITWDELEDYLNNSPPNVCPPADGEPGYPDPERPCPELYVVMDSETYDTDFVCIEDDPANGTLKCDFDGDGESDWLASGGRSWLDLDGNQAANDCEHMSEGASELTYWIENGFVNPSNPSDPLCRLSIHTWVPAQTGVSTSIFQEVEDRRQTNPLVVVPVFDAFCPDGDPRTALGCVDLWHPNATDPSNDTIKELTAASPQYFHIDDFTAFYITCVRLNNGDYCPGAERIELLNGNKPSLKSIEGYFLEGTVPGLGGRGDPDSDTGVYTFYLTR